MYPYWESIIQPILELHRPKVVVEVGSERGNTTRLLLKFCWKNRAVLHAIDPAPMFDVEAQLKDHGERFIFHRSTSLSALPKIEFFDLVLIDGDHNWYTVFHELQAIEEQSRAFQFAFPMVLLHDVDWPYGRRDMYYDPSTIPEKFRQPFARNGILPSDPGIQTSGGHAPYLTHAVSEGSERNGVRTAIEDFIQETSLELEFIDIPGFHGLGLLFPQSFRTETPVLCSMLDAWNFPEPIRQYIDRLEQVRVKLAIKSSQQPEQADAKYSINQAKMARMEERIHVLLSDLQAAEADLQQLKKTLPSAGESRKAAELPSGTE